jgi:hypothetical protein
MVGADVRQVESEIDACLREMAVWNVRRDVLLQRLLTLWRDGRKDRPCIFSGLPTRLCMTQSAAAEIVSNPPT